MLIYRMLLLYCKINCCFYIRFLSSIITIMVLMKRFPNHCLSVVDNLHMHVKSCELDPLPTWLLKECKAELVSQIT